VLLVIVATMAAIAFCLAQKEFRRSEVVHLAVKTASEDPLAVEMVGPNPEIGQFIRGSQFIINGAGEASLIIPIRGERASGKLEVAATFEQGVWTIEMLVLNCRENSHTVVRSGESP